MIKWSDEQKLAFTKRGSNILLSAAAGSGKTSVLTQRVIQLMEDDQKDIDKFLIFTFTRAAAANMKEKIMEKIVKGLDDPERAEFYREQLTKINQASIVTIHSFCNSVIRENFYFLGIDPNFSIYEETQSETVKSDILDRLFEERYRQKDQSFQDLVEVYCDNRDDRKLAQLILELYNDSVNHVDFEQWKQEMFVRFEDENLWLKLLKNHLNDYLDHACGTIDIILDMVSGEGSIEAFFIEEREQLINAKSLLENDIRSFDVVFKTLRWPKEFDIELKARVNALRKSYRDGINDMKKRYYGEVNIDGHLEMFYSQLPVLKDLLGLLSEFASAFLAYKKSHNVLEYSDLEHFTLEILKEEEVSKRYQDQYDYVFVDEYQDSSYIQEAIIQRIVRKENLFMVGDLKQSIYKFRSAVPEIFADKYRLFSRDEAAVDFKLDLNKNFRSRKSILDFINYVFTGLMTDSFGGMDYDETTRLYHGNHSFDGSDAPVEIHLVRSGHEILSKVDLEVQEIAERIQKLNKEERIPLKDIVIIMRSPSTHVEAFTRIFKLRGIPFFSSKSYEFIETLEVQQMLNFLRVLDNPLQDIPLVSLMRSPIFGFTDGDLIEIRSWNTRNPFHKNVFSYDNSDDLEAKLDEMKGRINRLRQFSRHLSIGDMIWKIYSEDGYENFFASLPDGDQRESNVRLLIQIASEYETFNHASLKQFLDYFTALEKRGQIEGSPLLGENADAVRLMTTHGSKGLEFPVVILAGMNKGFNISDASGDIIYHRKMGMLSKYIDPKKRVRFTTFHRDLIQEMMKREMREEEMRLMYTAMTRAEERLLIFATINDKQFDDKIDNWENGINLKGKEKTDQYIEWIMSSISVAKPMPVANFRLVAIKTEGKSYPEINPGRAKLAQKDLMAAFQSKEYKAIPEYQAPKWRKGPTKVSVTDIAHQSLGQLDKIDIKYFSEKKKKSTLSSTELGTQIHKVIELVKLDRLGSYQEFLDQIEWIKSNELVHGEIDELFDMKNIYEFFTSPLGIRLLASERVFRERPFVLKESSQGIESIDTGDDVLIQGIIDCYFIEDGKAILIDFKSDQVNEMTETYAIPKYTVQLGYYAKAIEKLTGVPVSEKYIHFIRNNDSHRIG